MRNYTIRLMLFIPLWMAMGCKSSKEEFVPAHIRELTGTYMKQSHSENVDGTSQTHTKQIDISKSDQGANLVNITYLSVVKRYKGIVETPELNQIFGPWIFKNVVVSDSGTVDHKEIQITNFGGLPDDPVETVLSISGGVVEKTLTITFGTDYPSKNLFNKTVLWLNKVN